MRLLLIRHAKAEDAAVWSSDVVRPLAPEGRRQAEHLGARLVELGLACEQLLASPLLRARETAELLRVAGAGPEPEEWDVLAPGSDLSELVPTLARLRDAAVARVGLVGHLPSLVNWAEELAWGETRGRLVLKPAGVIGLELPDSGSLAGRCVLFWLTSPKLLP
jgi:phosphohistidine phosphatase